MSQHISGINQLLVLSAISEGHQTNTDIIKHISDKSESNIRSQRVSECIQSLTKSGFILKDDNEGLLVTPLGSTELSQRITCIVNAAKEATTPILEGLKDLNKMNRWPYYSEWLEAHAQNTANPYSGDINTPTHNYAVFPVQIEDQRALIIHGEPHDFIETIANKVFKKTAPAETILLFEIDDASNARSERWLVRTKEDTTNKIGELPFIQRKVAERALIIALT